MRRKSSSLAALTACVLLASSPAMAADISADASLVSDYRYRGISLSDGKPAAQLDIWLEQESGIHAELWASAIREPASAMRLELEAAGGYQFEFAEHWSLDFTGTYYVYPGDPDSNYAEGTVTAEYSRNALTLGLGASYAPKQSGTRDEEGNARGDAYYFATATYEPDNMPISLRAAFGYERGVFDETDDGGKWDWLAGVEYKLEPARVGLAYTGSNSGNEALVASLTVGF